MSQILKLTHENQQLKRQISQYKQVLGVSPFIDDSTLKGGYRVVKTIADRDKIDCCHSKQGMIVCVIGGDLSFKEYRLISDCKNKQWEEINVIVEENEVFLIEDYSELSENLTTQKELNLVLKQLILKLQTQIDNIELTDEKVQITEETPFAQIGDTQKDFNKNISDYKETIDIKNIEQDERIENLEGINYTWSPTNRTLTLFDSNGTQLSQVSLVSLDNEGTDIRYNASTLSLELYNADNELLDSIPVSSFIGSVGTQLQLNSNQLQLKDSQGNVLSTVSFEISNINGLQTALDGKLSIPTMTNNYYGLWDDTNKKFINGQLSQDTNGNIGLGIAPTNSKLEISPLVNQTTLKISNYSLTGSNNQPALDINGTWNTTGAPTLIKANVTDTTSNTNSLLMDLQVGGVSKMKITKDGTVFGSAADFFQFRSYNGQANIHLTGNYFTAQSEVVGHIRTLHTFSGNLGTNRYISFLSQPTINQTGEANGITRGLYINPTLTSAADWRSIEWSNNTGYGLYGAGSAKNYLEGNLGIGRTSPVEKLDVNGNVKAIDFKGKSLKFDLQPTITPTRNTLVPKTDGSGLLWYDNNSILRNIGENFFSADLSNTTARNHTMNAGVTVNTLGNPYSITGLPNKNADITNFRKVRVQNASGLDAVIDSKNMLLDMPSYLTEQERTAWKTAMNGGWTTNTMSVAIITPPVVDKQDKNHWLTLKGANLNLNPANFSIEIMDSTGVNVVATIPNSQIQLYISGLDLTLYYNFKDLPIGTYRFRLNNGTATYTTGASISLTVVQLLQYQDLSAISWSKKLWNNNTTSTLSSGSGNSAVYIPDPSVKSLANDGSFVCALLSQQIIPENQDFQIEFTISVTSNSGDKLASYIAGLVPSASSVELTNQTNFGVSLKSIDVAFKVDYFRDNDISVWISTNTNQNSATFKVIATRRGGIITSLYQGLTSIAFAQKSYTNSALKIGLYTQNTAIGDLNVGLNIDSLVFF